MQQTHGSCCLHHTAAVVAIMADFDRRKYWQDYYHTNPEPATPATSASYPSPSAAAIEAADAAVSAITACEAYQVAGRAYGDPTTWPDARCTECNCCQGEESRHDCRVHCDGCAALLAGDPAACPGDDLYCDFCVACCDGDGGGHYSGKRLRASQRDQARTAYRELSTKADSAALAYRAVVSLATSVPKPK